MVTGAPNCEKVTSIWVLASGLPVELPGAGFGTANWTIRPWVSNQIWAVRVVWFALGAWKGAGIVTWYSVATAPPTVAVAPVVVEDVA